MKILVADKISPNGVDFFKAQPGFEVVEAYGSSAEQILELVKDADAIAVRSETKVTAAVLAAAPKLKVIGRAGVGVDNVDIDAASERGVIVMNTPGGNTIATAELTFTHMLAATRPITQAAASMKAGRWDRKILGGFELNGKTLGICGMGRIGAEVAKRAKAFNMDVLAYDPYLTPIRAEQLGVKKVELEAIFTGSDYITVHMPLTDQTRHMIDEKAIAKMKQGVRLFNCARGGIIKESALIEGIKSGKVAAAGLDVYEDEPLAKDSELRSLDQVVLTPHLGASTLEAQESVGVEIAHQIVEALNGGMVRNAINMPSIDPKALEALRPYLKLSEQLGSFIQQLSKDTVEKLRITFSGKLAELDILPLSRAVQRGYLREISPNVNDINAPKKLQALGVAVEVIKSNIEGEYTELIQVETFEATGKEREVSGTLFGKNQIPRIIEIDGFGVEVNTDGILLLVKNKDVPGIVGFLGTALADDSVNIANLSLARSSSEGFAISVVEIDSVPSKATQDKIANHSAIEKFKIIKL